MAPLPSWCTQPHPPVSSGYLSQRILIVSAPSGAGKTSLTRALVGRRPDIGLAISHTTRDRRFGEQDGVHYHFVSREEFERLIAADGFLEYATVFGHYYGTSVQAIESLIGGEKYAVLDIDWQGARSVRARFPGAKSVFVMPPSIEALEQRLHQRQRDDHEVIAARMKVAVSEMSHRDEYEYVLVNDDFEQTVEELGRILLESA